MNAPRIEVDLDKLRRNARHLVERLRPRGIAVTAVTKAVCGHPEISQALLGGGVSGLADARIENVERMRQAGIRAPIALLRPPTPSQASRVVEHCTTSYNTELDTIDTLARAAQRMGRVHDVILMVELGDMREGILPVDLLRAARAVVKMPGVALTGIGANFACLGGIAPTAEKMTELAALAAEVERVCGQELRTVSGGNSTSLPWAFSHAQATPINNLRLGEAILLGINPLSGCQIDGMFTDAFSLVVDVIESKIKPGDLTGSKKPTGMPINAVFSGHRRAWQAILAIGNQDTDLGGLTFPEGLSSLGGTSDQLVVETSGLDLPIGSEVVLKPDYNALMRAMNAPGVAKVLHNRRPWASDARVGRRRPDLVLV